MQHRLENDPLFPVCAWIAIAIGIFCTYTLVATLETQATELAASRDATEAALYNDLRNARIAQ